jgi:tricorn protease
LGTAAGHLIYFRGPTDYYGRGSDVQPALFKYSLEDRESELLAEPIFGAAGTNDGSKVLVRGPGGFQLIDVAAGKGSAKGVSTSGLVVDRVPKQEWVQIFDEVWRRFRDFFYVENMHGYDWEALRDQYRPLLKWVNHRADLNFVISEMVAELSSSHTYIAGGDWEIPDRPRVALAGADLELDAEAGRYRIAKIYAGDNAEDRYRSPLTEVGVDASVGDYVLAINGDDLSATDNPYRMLRYRAGDPVTFTLNDSPSMDGAREVTFRPITSERSLRYLEWVQRNYDYVTEATDGRVGYFHVPDMGVDGIREFIKWFYPQVRKEGLVIDVRGNGGGNVSQMLIERLGRELLATGFSRNSEFTDTYPNTVFYGQMVCLLSETSASDGDIFPAMFREAGLGPLIGKRSWGGVIGITNRGTLIDGGAVNVPEFGNANAEGEWDIEGYGVDPDIEVENTPKSIIEGKDLQLDRGIEEVMRMIEENPKRLPTKPAAPNKNQ